MLSSIWCGLRPSPTESEPCGSKSTSSTLRPYSASEAPRLIVVVVLPTPPFWLHIDTTRARPRALTGPGSGRSGIGRPVGPSLGSVTGAALGGRSKGRGSDTGSSSRGSGEGVDVRKVGGISPASNVPPVLIPAPPRLVDTATCGRLAWSLGPPSDSDNSGAETPKQTRKSVHSAPLGCTVQGLPVHSPVEDGSARGGSGDQVLVVRVLADPALDERAERQHLVGPGASYVVEREACQRPTDPVTLELRVHLGVREDHQLVGQLVDGEPGELAVEVRL